MEYRKLGKTGWNVSVIGYRAAPLGGVYGKLNEKEGIRSVHTAIDLGINFIDTAPYYGATASETVLGKVDSGFRIATAPQAVPRWRRR
jgi:aryl-alcohol dehydrogenase-like predicted oxidoreductase